MWLGRLLVKIKKAALQAAIEQYTIRRYFVL